MLTASFQGLVQYVWHDFCGIVGSLHTCCIAPGWFGAVRYLLLYEFGDGWQGNEQTEKMLHSQAEFSFAT